MKPLVSDANRVATGTNCGVYTPDRRRHQFRFTYDPTANGGIGRMTVTLDGVERSFDLTAEQRKTGAVFNRFGLANVRRGGHSVQFYLDDLTYTARRAADTRPKFIPQSTVTIPYPHKQAGRRY